MVDFQIPVVVEFEFAYTGDKTNTDIEINYMTDLMAICGDECLADVHIISDELYNDIRFYRLLGTKFDN